MTSPRVLPSIEALLQRPAARALEAEFGRNALLLAARDAVSSLRDRLVAEERSGSPDPLPQSSDEAAAMLEAGLAVSLRAMVAPSLKPVINATGVILHTNLGRAPLGAPALQHLLKVAGGYSNLEYDLAAGTRGARHVHAETLLRRVTGAEAAVVVNNNAAAALLVLTALAAGREVIVSRGELVEIGGGFRVPDIMRQSGARLREVGTTNRTRIADYAAAIGEQTGLILRVHPSNFRIEGFTERPPLAGLVALGRQFTIPVVEDLGSGNVFGTRGGELAGPRSTSADEVSGKAPDALADEPTVQSSVNAEVDLVFFSGDKLLGGPQAGIIVGRADLVSQIRRHPLMRALRVDKLTYAALEATLIEYATGRASRTVPVAAMIAASPRELDVRARAIQGQLADLGGLQCSTSSGASTIGGGSAPGTTIRTSLLRLRLDGLSPKALESRLRALSPPVIARIDDDDVVLDLRTVLPEQDRMLAAGLRSVVDTEAGRGQP